MKYLKVLGKAFLYFIITLFILMFILTLLSYYNILGKEVISIIKIIIPTISIIIPGFILGKHATKKGWFEGLKFGTLIFLISLLLNCILFKDYVNLRYFIFYFILLFACISGSMIGINKKAN